MAKEIQNDSAENGTKEYFGETDPLTENANAGNEKTNRSLKENLLFIINNVTVEPTMFFFVFANILSVLISQNLCLEKACRVNLNFTTEICDALKLQTLDEQNVYERDVQRLVASAVSWKTLITATIPCAMALFIGSWSDTTGHRKVFIIVTIFGQILIGINGILNTYFFYELKMEILVLIEAIIEGLTGSWCICILVMFSFICDITDHSNRTFRMGFLYFGLTVAIPIATGVSGILLKSVGYYGSYGVVTSFHLINLIYNAFILKNPERKPEQRMHDGKGIKYFFQLFFDVSNVKETFKVVFKKGENNRRVRICILLFVISTIFGPMQGELSILYISSRYRFNWNEVKFSVFQAYNSVVHTFGTIFSVTFFSKYLNWHDSVLGIISTVSKISASFVYCFAPNERIFFIAPFIDIFNGTALLAVRTSCSKLISSNEFGKMNSILALAENLTPLVYIPMYAKVYVSTMEVLPGAVFLIGSAITLPAVIFFIFLFWEHITMKRKQNIVICEDQTTEERLQSGDIKILPDTKELHLSNDVAQISSKES